ncbi:Mce protein [Mycobacterium sp. CVI_P3]|uniref:Mce protein n=1 Tax=Mycobacterium pinniadriaticum TaxID=2994102 RepID=A0ABT3SMN9_9MYCO|nr:Mce protein [Mycobacterium pinniadriaticum]MCX2934365.1 Mce protein [Mycobacterium pinniadriaticum]MCX2940788.1 Mce protein [Mycobacterium pinniadriaticum]
MEGDAGSGRLIPPATTDDDAERSGAEESVKPEPADAERSEAQEPVNETPATTDDEIVESETTADETNAAQGEQPRGSRLSGRRLVTVCAALVIVSLLVATGGFFALRAHQKSVASARAEAVALAAAKDCVTATQAPDATAMAASQEKIIDCATGDFGAQATLYSGLLVDAYQAAKVQVQVSNMRAAVERHNDDGSMDVLVAVRVKVSNTATQDQEQGYRLRVRMAPEGGTYKIAKLDQVSK